MSFSQTKPLLAAALAAAACAGTATTSHAAFVLVDNFDGLTPGDISGQNGWSSNSVDFEVGADPAPFAAGDQVLDNGDSGATAGEEGAYKPFAASIADNTTGTLFFQLRLNEANAAASFGIGSDTITPDFDDYRAQLAVTGAGNFAARDGASTSTLDQQLAIDTWYDIWIVANSTTDTFEVYIQGGAYGSQTKLTVGTTDEFGYRGGATTDGLGNFLLMSGNTTGDSVLIDNIYVDSTSENLVNPIPEPGSLALLALGGLMVARRRRG